MNDIVAAELLERYTPSALDASPSWTDVLDRAGISPTQTPPSISPVTSRAVPRGSQRWRRLVVVAVATGMGVAVLATVTPAGSAIARTLGDFSAWITGLPGRPAPSSDRDALNRATRSWAGFPRGTRLHRLLQTRIDGVGVALDGFRVGDSLCLQVVASGVAHGSEQSCAPLTQLKTQTAPALVVLTDAAFGTIAGKHVQIGPYVYTHSVRVDVTVGILADGVNQIQVGGTSGGLRQALVGGDAFMAVADRPPVAYRTNQAWATVAGSRVAIPLAEAPFDQLNTSPTKSRKPLGPSTVQRHISGGSIAWLEQRQPRGQPVPTSGLFKRLDRLHFIKRILFQRLIAPDPNSPLREIVRLELRKSYPFKNRQGVQACNLLLDRNGAGGGCNPLSDLFNHGPVNIGETLQNGGDQYDAIDGLVSDDVHRVELFLATGEQIAVPLLNNVFIAQINRSSFPIRVVAYDRQGRRIDVQTLTDVGGSMAGPTLAAGAKWHTVLSETSPVGKRAKILIATRAGGGTCASFQVSDGSSQGGCTFKPWRGPTLNLSYSSLTDTQGPAFIWGQVPPEIATVNILLADGTTLHIKPVEGLVLAALPRGFHLGRHDRVIGYDNHGREVASQQLPAT